MKRKWLLAISLALVLVMVGLCSCSAGDATFGGSPSALQVNLTNQQEGIWVSGQGKVTAIPDIAILRLGIEAQEVSVAQAQTLATEAMDEVMVTLVDNGIAEKDIQTQYFSIRQVTKWDREAEEQIVIGYRVTHTVTAKIREIDKTGTIIDAVAEAGGDLTRISNVSFSIDEPSAYYEEARQEAMADAKAKAEQLAELAGVTLGKPTYISEGTQIPPPVYRAGVAYEEAAPVPETPISPGEIEVSLTVQVGYAVKLTKNL